MPRRKHGQNVTNLGADSTENMTQNRDAELKWRDTTLCELQSMFSGSVDAEVVQLVLSESNYNGRYMCRLIFYCNTVFNAIYVHFLLEL